MDSDKVLVMDAGHVVEFGSPYELLTASKAKVFHGMVMQTGKASFDHLLKVAENVSTKVENFINKLTFPSILDQTKPYLKLTFLSY